MIWDKGVKISIGQKSGRKPNNRFLLGCVKECGEMSIIEIKNLTKLYKNGRGIKNISINVEQGDIVGLLGPNGSGKTTTMKTILGLCRPDSGEITVFGKSMEDNFEENMEKIGALIEAPAFYTEMTARNNLELFARHYKNVTKSRIDHVLEMVRLSQ